MSLQKILLELLSGMVTSSEIFLLTLLLALPLGLLISFSRMAKFRVLRFLTQFYISVMRGTPLMLQLLVVYYGPYFIFGIRITNEYRFIAVIIGFVLNYAAYFAEIYRGGIQSIPVGQYEAAKVLGYSRAQCFGRIIMPQVIKRIIPALTNEIITLIKDTSLSFALAVPEMFTTAKAIAAADKTMPAFAAAGVFYYVFNLLVAGIMRKVEQKLSYYR